MSRVHRELGAACLSVLLVDDDEDYLEATRLLLLSEGFSVTAVASGELALRALSEGRFDVVLVDYWMPQMRGDRLIQTIRAVDRQVQILLQSGYANEQPPRVLLKTLDVQGYVDKSEGPERLLLWMDVAAKAARALGRLRNAERSLDAVLTASARLHRLGPVEDLYGEVLGTAGALLGLEGAVLGLFPDAIGEEDDLRVVEEAAGAARLIRGWGSCALGGETTRVLSLPALNSVRMALETRRTSLDYPWLTLPLTVGEHVLGFVACRLREQPTMEMELCDVFSQQIAAAIQNALYYQMAALDPLTGVHARRFFEGWTRRELRAALRSGVPLSLLLVDMDRLKSINSIGGHRAGDAALARLGAVLRDATREHDLAARLGGDEFAMILPSTEAEGARCVAERILERIAAVHLGDEGASVELGVSIGVGVIHAAGPCPALVGRTLSSSFFDEMVERLLGRADEAMYRAKRDGGNRLVVAEPIVVPWISTERPNAEGEESLA